MVAGIVVFDASGPSTGVAEVSAGSATITIIGGGFAKGERISVAAKKNGFDFLLTGSLGSRDSTSDLAANDNGAFSITVDLDGWPVGEIFSLNASGDQGHRASTAFMLVDKVAG